ncbi:MAG: pyridine nucleotide-disulfide oxidoreductase [Betaproteobacteria bacterium]|nr:pyridine nucleotide-disulfide oxidoreductase [Betaproteobacteria bacterium]
MPDDARVSGMPAATALPEARTPAVPSAASRRGRASSHRDIRIMAVAALLLAGALAAATLGRWTPGSDTGYWLGVAGGVAMLLVLAYPLRKRLGIAQRFGRMRVWFALHMLLGIAAPLLAILHSRLQFGSLNATVAFAVMALVATSGFVGRFLYARIHHGLYGEKASLEQLRRAAGNGAEALHAQLTLAPEVVAALDAFAERAEALGRAGLRRPLALGLLGVRSRFVRFRCRRLLRVAHDGGGHDRARAARRLERRDALVDAHLAAVVRVAQFAAFERLFAWWHVLHLPLVWLLAASVVAHVVAVHMY